MKGSSLCLLIWLGLCSTVLASHYFNVNQPSFSNVSLLQAQPYRTAFHFQPPSNWMNDPAGLMLFKGYYHLFYQYNPYAAVWGNITWGHAVSTDLINWRILELALVPDHWYDLYGCWTGSATFIKPNTPVLLYTGWSNVSFSTDNQVQMQAMAVPRDTDDPLLQKWDKIPQNPIIEAPSFINGTKFRDPTTGWIGADGRWRILIGARQGEHTGLALLYTSKDFVSWELAKNPLHSVPLTGMWECPDFYPISIHGKQGLDTSTNGPNVMHVLKVSLDDLKHDYYAVGTYITSNDSFLPKNTMLDVGIGLRYNYGKFYASKSFYDKSEGRRILFGWVNESSSNISDISKGWSSLQSIPRMVWLDGDTKSSLLQWPIKEVESLHKSNTSLSSLHLEEGSIFEVKGVSGAQLDVEVEFELSSLERAEKVDVNSSNVQLICSNIGASRNGVIGPFGLLVLVSDDLIEQTALFFYIVSTNQGWKALVCSDQSRSSLATDVDKTTYGSYMSISNDETTLHLRALVDHSIVETFAEGGRICITSRVYPIKAVFEAVHLYVFNNGSTLVKVKNLIAWDMAKAKIE